MKMKRNSSSKKKKMQEALKLSVKDIALIGMMIAVLEVCKRVLDFIPNVELVTFWIIMFTLFLGKKAIYGVFGFILIEGLVFGFHVWWIMYLYLWPALVLVTLFFKKNEFGILWAIISGIFGLVFGLAGSIPYIFIGAVDGGISGGLYMAFSWWIAGIPWDLVHGVANFVVMLILYNPIRHIMKKVEFNNQE
jgi:energy-coupling factor transport system substrate-specific component